MPTNSQSIIVLGMHRSGTSALTGVLSLLGIEVGDNLVPANEEVNSKGFWEHAEIVSLHDRLLALLGYSWQDERNLPERWWTYPEVEPLRQELTQILRTHFMGINPWAIKDPRMCRLLPIWPAAFEENGCLPHVIIILRDPREVVQSLARRDGIPEERSYLLWLQHVFDSEKWTRHYPRVLITFEELLDDWRATIDKISLTLSLEFPYKYDEDAQRSIDSFLEPSLRHHMAKSPPSGPLAHLALETYQACVCAHDPNQMRVTLELMAAETMELAKLLAPWSQEIQALWHVRSELAARDDLIEILNREIARIKGTVSWNITAPLRVVWNVGLKLIDKVINSSHVNQDRGS